MPINYVQFRSQKPGNFPILLLFLIMQPLALFFTLCPLFLEVNSSVAPPRISPRAPPRPWWPQMWPPGDWTWKTSRWWCAAWRWAPRWRWLEASCGHGDSIDLFREAVLKCFPPFLLPARVLFPHGNSLQREARGNVEYGSHMIGDHWRLTKN